MARVPRITSTQGIRNAPTDASRACHDLNGRRVHSRLRRSSSEGCAGPRAARNTRHSAAPMGPGL
eukprot:15438029-Alexandrium_andersonii.AAC.1